MIFRFGQAGGFVKLRERFESIMGFKKSDLTSSIISEEKVLSEVMEKENEESKSNATESIISTTESMEVCTLKCYNLYKIYVMDDAPR